MVKHFKSKLNSLQRLLPEGLLAPTSWLEARGYSRSLIAAYARRGWLESPMRGVYRRPGSLLDWKHIVATLQQQTLDPLAPIPHVGGLTALQHRGKAHYVPGQAQPVLLYGPMALPAWARTTLLAEKPIMRPDAMFATLRVHRGQGGSLVDARGAPLGEDALAERGLMEVALGRDEWRFLYATEERAMLEMANDVPRRETLDHADLVMQGLAGLRPSRVTALLAACSSVKGKRLFLALAERHRHAWLERLEWSAFNWGTGKRQLFAGEPMHPKYQISWPKFDERS